MPTLRLKWSNLFAIPELDFLDAAPGLINVSDELQLTLAWLTGATQSERKLLRCDNNGALLVSDPWNGFNVAETDQLVIASGAEDTFSASAENCGCLVSTGIYLTKVFFYRVTGVLADTVYVPGDSYYWYPHSIVTLVTETVPPASGPNNVIGITTYI